jgi:enterochelin esterase family protein
LGDPSQRKIISYLPAGARAAGRRFATVYVLAGFTRTGSSLLAFQPWEETFSERMDRLIAEGRLQPMIVIFPDGMTRLGGSQYINSSATGRYQDHLMEVVAWADGTLPTIPRASARAVAGKSSGGYGALRAGMDHPEAFGLVADHSGDSYFEMCYGPALVRFVRAIGRHDLERCFRDPRNSRPHDQAFFDIMEVLAMASCYSPAPGSPWGFDLPVDPATGEIRGDVWARWKEQDPLNLVEAKAEALRGLRLLYLDCGDRDEYQLDVGTRLFHRKLEDLKIPHHYETFDDGHFNTSYRYDVSLTAISRAIDHDA